MLVLTRKSGEKIHIGDDIVIEVKRVSGNRVTVAILAPADVRILRGELAEAVAEFEGPDDSGSRVVASKVSGSPPPQAPQGAPVVETSLVEPYLGSRRRIDPPEVLPPAV